MAKASKPVSILSRNISKEEKQNRLEQEDKLKGDDNLVYNPPKEMSKEGKKVYKFIVDQLRSSNVLSNLDIPLLETTVDSILKMKECKKIIDKTGLIVDDKRNPATIIYKDYNAIFNKCMMELGLSPSSRSRLAQVNVDAIQQQNDPLLKILNGNKESKWGQFLK